MGAAGAEAAEGAKSSGFVPKAGGGLAQESSVPVGFRQNRVKKLCPNHFSKRISTSRGHFLLGHKICKNIYLNKNFAGPEGYSSVLSAALSRP